MNELPILDLGKAGKQISLTPVFFNATDGTAAKFETKVGLTFYEKYLRVDFECFENNFTSQNALKVDNGPLYDQEVFEVFISAGEGDPAHYFEIEINPNNAIWLGKMSNPTLGLSNVTIDKMLLKQDVNVKHDVKVRGNTWGGFIVIPWKLLSETPSNQYRLNFYRIRSNTSHANTEWTCDAQSCDFVCWSSTLSGTEPAFHRPRRFGLLNII
jgi:Carbohydrate-binding family 9